MCGLGFKEDLKTIVLHLKDHVVAVNQLDEKVSLFRTRTAYNRFSHRARIKTFTALFKQDKFGFKIDLVPSLSARRRGRPRVWLRRRVCTGGCRPGGTAVGTGWRAAGRNTRTLGAWWWPGWTGRGSGCTWLGSTSPGTHGSRLGYQLYQVKIQKRMRVEIEYTFIWVTLEI